MGASVQNAFKDLTYYSLFDIAEKARWNMTDIPWDEIDHSKVTPELIESIKTMAFGELTTFSATQSFMAMFSDEVDFTQWLAVWLYEETKHPHALVKWLHLVGCDVDSKFLMQGREITPMTPSRVEMLTFNIISEIVAGNMYVRFGEILEEPVLRQIVLHLAKDEMRHSVGFENYTRISIRDAEDPDKERITALRAAWAFLQEDGLISHPVFLTVNRVSNIMGEDTVRKIRKAVASRIGKVVGVEIPDPDKIFEVYSEFKRDYRAKKGPRKLAPVAIPA